MSCPAITPAVDSLRGGLNRFGVFIAALKKRCPTRTGANLAWCKKPGRGYQTRINRALRQVMMEERESGE